MNRDAVEACTRRLRNEHSLYDQTVDVVSCWEALFSSVEYDMQAPRFIRFPRCDGDLRPDFVAIFPCGYNLIADVVRSISPDALDRKMRQLGRYTQPLALQWEGDSIRITDQDVLLLVGHQYSGQTFVQLRDAQAMPEYGFAEERNLILVSYVFATQDTSPCYQFSWYPDPDNAIFRDRERLGELSLARQFQDLRRGAVASPGEFSQYKARAVFCNDTPPAIYTIVHLWARVFLKLVPQTDPRWRDLRNGRSVRIAVDVQELAALCGSCEGGDSWIVAAMNTLCEAGLAHAVQEDRRYIVYYCDLARRTRQPRHLAPADAERDRDRELCHCLAEIICSAPASPVAPRPRPTGPPVQLPLIEE